MIDIEKKVLGALMLSSDAYYQAGHIHEGQFTTVHHQKIFRVIEDTVNKGKRPDLVTVNKQIIDASYLSDLMMGVGTGDNIGQWVLSLEEDYKRRGLSSIGERVVNSKGDIFEDIENTITDCYSLLDVKGHNSEGISTDLMKDLSESLEEKNYKGVQSGLVDMDNLLGGFHKGQMVVIAGRPGMGKSALATTIALNSGVNTAIFSLEMTKLEVMARMVSAKLDIPIDSLEKKNVGMNNKERIKQASIDNVIVNDTPGMTVNQVRMTATRYKKMYDIKMVIVDYIQLMQGGKRYSGNRLQEVGEISRGLKQLAKELDVPVIALSQLARSAESEKGSKPKLRHLRESGEIEQDANVVILLWSPEYYGIPQDESGSPYPKSYIELIVAKNRNGKKDVIPLQFSGQYAKFVDINRMRQELPEWVS